jgi:hypothetical protein
MVVSAAIGALTLLSWMHLARLTGSLGAAASGRARHAAMGIPEMAAWGWPLTVWGVWLGRPA